MGLYNVHSGRRPPVKMAAGYPFGALCPVRLYASAEIDLSSSSWVSLVIL